MATIALLVGCARPRPPAAITATAADSAGTAVITLDRPLAEVALGVAGSANDSAALLFTVDSMTHPVAVAFLSTGTTAVLDRSDRTILLFDPTGAPAGSLGRAGTGPGELEIPTGLIALDTALVLLQSNPVNILVRYAAGAVAAVGPPIPGDWNGWRWQRPDIALEFPIQSAPEIWSRRLRAFDASTFVVFVGPVDQDTSRRAAGLLLRFDRDLDLLDTIVAFDAVPRELRPAGDRRGAPQLFQQVWGPRMVWTAGDGRLATGQNDLGWVNVTDPAGGSRWIVRWPVAASPVTEGDREALGERIMNATLAASPEAAANAAAMSRSERLEMLRQFMSTYDLAPVRPEFTALFLSGGCLWLAGFDATDDADGTGHEWLVVDLDRPSAAPRVITIGGAAERVVTIDRGKAATIRLEEDGFRRVRVYRVPTCGVQ